MKKTIFSKISTKPSPASLKWAGKEVSLLSNILLWSLWLCRVFSLLQICKLIYRSILTWAKKGSTDAKAARPNVPPMFCEIYFIVWFLVLMTGHLLEWENVFYYGAICYYLFESIVWVLYYTVFRRFYEENYSIYHELEYLTVLLLVVPTQALGFATLYDQSFRQILAGLMGVAEDSAPFPVRILGALFAAIVISMIISAFPAEAVKKYIKKPKTMIIGNGDVVRNRLLKALKKEGYSKVRIYDLGSAKNSQDNIRYLPTEQTLCDAVTEMADPQSVVWISTPSYAHISYLTKLAETKISLIVLEKPITCKKEELDQVRELIRDESKRKKIFFLSYYILEKALPLQYLKEKNADYLPFLEIEDKLALHNWRLRLGPLQSAKVVIHEGPEGRDWALDDANGGQLLETFLHNVLIAAMFCGLPQTWQDVKWNRSTENHIHTIEMTAKSGKAAIALSQKKNASEQDRSRLAQFVFENGRIDADLDNRSVRLYFDDIGKATSICVSDRYPEKYQVLVNMVERVHNGSCTAEDIDGLKNQLSVTQWLLEQLELMNRQ